MDSCCIEKCEAKLPRQLQNLHALVTSPWTSPRRTTEQELNGVGEQPIQAKGQATVPELDVPLPSSEPLKQVTLSEPLLS